MTLELCYVLCGNLLDASVTIDVPFDDDATVDTTIDVIDQTKIDCSAENIAETDSLVTFPDAPTVGDCVGDGVRTDGKDPTKYTIIMNDDGTLAFNYDQGEESVCHGTRRVYYNLREALFDLITDDPEGRMYYVVESLDIALEFLGIVPEPLVAWYYLLEVLAMATEFLSIAPETFMLRYYLSEVLGTALDEH